MTETTTLPIEVILKIAFDSKARKAWRISTILYFLKNDSTEFLSKLYYKYPTILSDVSNGLRNTDDRTKDNCRIDLFTVRHPVLYNYLSNMVGITVDNSVVQSDQSNSNDVVANISYLLFS